MSGERKRQRDEKSGCQVTTAKFRLRRIPHERSAFTSVQMKMR